MADSLRTSLDRAKAIRRLLERATDRTPEDMPLEDRKAAGATQLDDKLGPRWRDEARVPGLVVVETKTLDAPPSPGARDRDQQRGDRNDMFAKVRAALNDEEETGETVQDDDGQDADPVPSADGLTPDMIAQIDDLIAQIRDILDCLPSD